MPLWIMLGTNNKFK
ncbi:MAG: hypothetical protein GX323_03780 [Clostridiales bacterium]|nr:hypothetical protein [Clostridiales bacterium]